MKKVKMNIEDVKNFIEVLKSAEYYSVSENGKSHDAVMNGRHIYFYQGEDDSDMAIMHVDADNIVRDGNEVVMVSDDIILGSIAYWAVSLHPYNFPENFKTVIDTMQSIITTEFSTDSGKISYKEFKRSEIENWLRDKLMSIPEFVDWNLSKVERERSILVDDENRAGHVFVSRFTSVPKEHDFIDLDAIIRNISNMIYRRSLYSI